MRPARAPFVAVVLALAAGRAASVALLHTARTHEDATPRPAARAAAHETAGPAARASPLARGAATAHEARAPVGASYGAAHRRDGVTAGGPATIDIPIGGTVDGLPESVHLSGFVHVTTTVVHDPDFRQPPAVLLAIDLSGVRAVGLSSGQRYVVSEQLHITRPLVASDLVEIAFSISPEGPGGLLLARAAAASFTLDFNAGTGRFSAETRSTVVGAVNTSG